MGAQGGGPSLRSLIGFPAVAVTFVALAVIISGYLLMLPGTRVLGIDIGWTTPNRAARTLMQSLDWEGVQVELHDGTASRVLRMSELGISPDYRGTVDQARRPLWRLGHKDYPLILIINEDVLERNLKWVDDSLKKDPVDSRLSITDTNRVQVVPHTIGRRVDLETLKQAITQGCRLYAMPKRIEIPFVSIEPAVTTDELEAYLPLEEISNYSTYYVDNNDRAHNIRLACQSFSEITVWPGQVFSFNRITGPRSPEMGYRKAPVIVGGRLVDDYGGGVCQVSSTIYVALLKAGFEIVERHNHGLPVSYVPLGLDATVAYDYLDLKMRNPYDTPCVIHCEAGWGTLTTLVFGKPIGSTVWLETTVLKEFPPPPVSAEESRGDGPEGQGDPGTSLRSGYLVETVRKFVVDGRIQTVERLNTSMYLPERHWEP